MVKSAQAITILFTTSNPTTGAAADASSTPTGTLYKNGTADAASVTVTNITTGVYKAAVTLPTLAAGDVVSLRISATVSSVAGEACVWQDVGDTVRMSDTLTANPASGGIVAASFGSGAINAAAIAADAIGASELAADAVAEIQAGLSTLDAAGVRAAVGLAAANLDTQLTAIDDYLDTEIAAIKAKTDLIPASPAAVGSAMTLSAAALDAIEIETGINGRQALALAIAALAGKLSGAAGTTVTIKGADNNTTRIVATVDSDGNRTAVTLTPPA